MKTKGIIVVGNRNGKRVIKWLNYLSLSFCLSAITGLGTGVVFYFLAGRWQHFPVMYGGAIGFGIVSLGLIVGMRTPVEKLQHLD